MFRKLKDQALSWGAERAIRSQMAAYGQLLSFQIDSGSKRIDFAVVLKGESEPIFGSILDYELINHGPKLLLGFSRIETTREWITVLLETLLPTRTIPLPQQAAQYSSLLQKII